MRHREDDELDLISGFMMPITRLRFSVPTLLMLLLAVLFVGAKDFDKAMPFAAFSFVFIWMDQRRLDEDRKKARATGSLGYAGFSEADAQQLRKVMQKRDSVVVAGARGTGLSAVMEFVRDQADPEAYQIPACGLGQAQAGLEPDPAVPWFEGDLAPTVHLSKERPFACAVGTQGASSLADVRREVRVALARALGISTADVPPFRLIWIQGAVSDSSNRKIWFD